MPISILLSYNGTPAEMLASACCHAPEMGPSGLGVGYASPPELLALWLLPGCASQAPDAPERTIPSRLESGPVSAGQRADRTLLSSREGLASGCSPCFSVPVMESGEGKVLHAERVAGIVPRETWYERGSFPHRFWDPASPGRNRPFASRTGSAALARWGPADRLPGGRRAHR